MKELTPKQKERLKAKIAGIRKALAAEKRKLGWYDASRGLRYLSPELYIKLQDYKGGLTFLRWFRKNFPDDMGFPDFLFEWTLILFNNSKEKEARRKALETWFTNTYLFDKFFGRPVVPIDKYEGFNLEAAVFAKISHIPQDRQAWKTSCIGWSNWSGLISSWIVPTASLY